MWVYDSPVGIIRIDLYPDHYVGEKYGIFYGGNCYGGYNDPVAAADDVFCHATGCNEIDCGINKPPRDLSEWEKV